MAPVGRGSDDGKRRRREKMIQKKEDMLKNERDQSKGNHCKENHNELHPGEQRELRQR